MGSDRSQSHQGDSEEQAQEEAFIEILQRMTDAMDSDDADEAELAAAEAMQHVIENYHPTPAEEFFNHACELVRSGEWEAAETDLLEVIQTQPEKVEQAKSELVGLYLCQQRLPEALQLAQEVRDSWMALDDEVLAAMGIELLSKVYLRINQPKDAAQILTPALDCLPAEAMFNHMRAKMLTLLAEARRQQAEWAQARELLEQAGELLEPMREMRTFTGIQLAIAKHWEISGRTHRSAGELQAAADDWRQAITTYRDAAIGFDDMANTDRTWAVRYCELIDDAVEALLAAGEEVDAEELRREAADLRIQWRLD